MVFWLKCYEEMVYGLVIFIFYLCVVKGQFVVLIGFLFGGIFLDIIFNLVIQQKNCLLYFYLIKIVKDLSVCVINDFENGEKYFMFFVGFYSCQNGNLVINGLDMIFNIIKFCFFGYSQYLVIMENECDLMYCIRLFIIFVSFYVLVYRFLFMRLFLEIN